MVSSSALKQWAAKESLGSLPNGRGVLVEKLKLNEQQEEQVLVLVMVMVLVLVLVLVEGNLL